MLSGTPPCARARRSLFLPTAAALLAALLGGTTGATAATTGFTCGDVSLTLSTGTPSGDCIVNPGAAAICIDADSNSAYARCESGCLSIHGAGSCSLSSEESVGGSFLVTCPEGKRYLLRTGTGQGDCSLKGQGSDRSARCEHRHNEASVACRTGCLETRGSGRCAVYRADTGE